MLICAQYGIEDEGLENDKHIRRMFDQYNDEEYKQKQEEMRQLELQRLRQEAQILKESENLIEELIPEDEVDVNNLKDEINEERDEFMRKINQASTDSEKKKLMRELDKKEQEWTEEIEREKELQEQALLERKKRIKLKREKNMFKQDTKNRQETLDKEIELMNFDAQKKMEKALELIKKTMKDRKNDKKLPLLIYKMLDEMIRNRLDDQNKMQFYELSGNLANLYTSIAFEKALMRKELEEDLDEKNKELDAKNLSAAQYQKEITKFEKELEKKGKEEEKELIRKQMEKRDELERTSSRNSLRRQKELRKRSFQNQRRYLE
jgi:hypothetical protein